MANLCIIPARGGSKRIPRKNIKEFLGKPMLSYPILLAKESNLFDEIMVSTDDTEIAEIATQYGATVPFKRSLETSNDFATTAEVIVEVLQKYREEGLSFENVCCLYPCTPLLEVKHVQNAFDVFLTEKNDSLVPIVSYEFPIQRALRIEQNRTRFVSSEHALTRSQDLEPNYHDTGQFYWLNVFSFLESKQIIGLNCGFIIMDEMYCQDIDVETDWRMAELKYKINHGIT
ncbi:MAG: pseudaminic acid cytidylyltransferase [Saprospiraceae bacterium]